MRLIFSETIEAIVCQKKLLFKIVQKILRESFFLPQFFVYSHVTTNLKIKVSDLKEFLATHFQVPSWINLWTFGIKTEPPMMFKWWRSADTFAYCELWSWPWRWNHLQMMNSSMNKVITYLNTNWIFSSSSFFWRKTLNSFRDLNYERQVSSLLIVLSSTDIFFKTKRALKNKKKTLPFLLFVGQIKYLTNDIAAKCSWSFLSSHLGENSCKFHLTTVSPCFKYKSGQQEVSIEQQSLF